MGTLPVECLFGDRSQNGHDALKLTATELELAALEVRAVFEDDDREKDLISIALDSWEIIRAL